MYQVQFWNLNINTVNNAEWIDGWADRQRNGRIDKTEKRRNRIPGEWTPIIQTEQGHLNK